MDVHSLLFLFVIYSALYPLSAGRKDVSSVSTSLLLRLISAASGRGGVWKYIQKIMLYSR